MFCVFQYLSVCVCLCACLFACLPVCVHACICVCAFAFESESVFECVCVCVPTLSLISWCLTMKLATSVLGPAEPGDPEW